MGVPMRWIKRILLGLAALGIAATGIVAVLLLVGWALLLFEESKEKAFYAERPLLLAMRDGLPYSATKALFDRVPRGTKRSEAVAIMSLEKITCEPRAVPGEADMMVCRAKGRPCGVPRWRIEIDFDERDEVRTGFAFALKAVCET
jgi:hypothetical protein